MLKNKTDYLDSGEYYYEERYQERLIKNLKRRAESLGFELVASPITSGFAKG